MVKPRGQEATAYIVRREHETDDDGKTYYADEPCNAAKQAAIHDHAHRSGWEWSWPVEYIVKDLGCGLRYKVEVERETVPEFHTNKAKVI